MINFESERTQTLLRHKKICNGINTAFITALFILAIILAACSKYAESNWGLYLGGLCFWGVLAAVYLISLFTITLPAGKKLNYEVCREIADGLLAREDMFKGGGAIDFTADYAGNILTLSRKDYAGEIIIDPTRKKPVESLGAAGAGVEIDVSALKAVPSVYSTVGTKIWLFLQAYYAVNAQKYGCERVTVTDNMGKAPLTLEIVKDGKPLKDASKNYFLVKNLIKK